MQKPGKHPLSVESGATGMGKWAQTFGGTGLLEMNIGRSGISMQLGMGGIDVGGALYDLGKRSYDKSMLKAYEREHGKDKGEAAYSAYVYGDWTQEHTAARLASGKDELYFSGGKEYTAKTSSNGKGGRRIEITDSKDRRLNAIQLGHEAYRDGRVGGNNAQETIAAVLGHTGMAVRMEEDGKRVAGSDLLRAEMEAYKRGDMDALLMNALTNYDSTDDYWKLMEDGTLVRDGRKSVYKETADGEFKLIDYEYLDSDVQSLAAMLNLQHKDIEAINREALKQGKVSEIISDYKSNWNTDLAQKLIDASNGTLVGAGMLADTTVGRYNAAYTILKKQIKVDFSEESFNEIVSNPGNVAGSQLGMYLDLTKLREEEQVPKITDGKDYATQTGFYNLGVSGTALYYTLEQMNVKLDFESMQVPNAIQGLTTKEQWMRDALGQTINQRTGRVSGTGFNEDMIDSQRNYLGGKYNTGALADAFGMARDIVSAGFTSFQNQTRFYQWSYNGVNCFTVFRSQNITDFNLAPMSRMDYYFNLSVRNMGEWLMMEDSAMKKFIKGWNNVWGWESSFTWRCK